MTEKGKFYVHDNNATPALNELLEKNGFVIVQKLESKNAFYIIAYYAEQKVRLLIGPFYFDIIDDFTLMFNYCSSATRPEF